MSRFLFFVVVALVLVACPSTTVATQVFDRAKSQNTEPQIPVTGAGTFDGCAGAMIPVINPAYEQTVVEMTNEIRMDHGLPPLKRVEHLDYAARYHTADMSFTDYFDHNTFGRRGDELVEECDTWNRIETYYTGWLALAENIAAGQRTPEMAIDGWMNSPDHRHNILSPNYTEIGVGYYEGRGEYRFYWGQNFGKRDGIYPLILNGEKAITDARDVPVYLFGEFSQMRLRNNDDTWGEWMPFQNTFTWRLPETPGEHRVTAEFRGKGRTFTASDTIELAP